ncbi:hypothetical protein FRC12_003627 [Ceratobasidium sp. 428]|nr:hypothetical protein FRC12_003627 [Ceratobasidium sp. 428]
MSKRSRVFASATGPHTCQRMIGKPYALSLPSRLSEVGHVPGRRTFLISRRKDVDWRVKHDWRIDSPAPERESDTNHEMTDDAQVESEATVMRTESDDRPEDKAGESGMMVVVWARRAERSSPLMKRAMVNWERQDFQPRPVTLRFLSAWVSYSRV